MHNRIPSSSYFDSFFFRLLVPDTFLSMEYFEVVLSCFFLKDYKSLAVNLLCVFVMTTSAVLLILITGCSIYTPITCLAYADVLPDEKLAITTGFLIRTIA